MRRKTSTVMVGDLGVGSAHPIRIQSMTTSITRDVVATVDQIKRLADAGCEIARVTVQGMKEAEACEAIKNALVQSGYRIPLVADIHFYPPAAMKVIEFVEKVRVNPGNFADRRASFQVLEYNDASYADELIKIEEKFTPLVEKCKRLNRAMRIGTNHGSLSDRVMNRFGDSPRGMVESALEFARICRKSDYHNFLFSMKASNPKVMIEAYRLLVDEMDKLGWDYPLHLGVTEAGEGEDGRIKSAMGIGSLLLEGLGDTIRVSLTEDPWLEVLPCKQLIAFAEAKRGPRSPGVISREVSFPKDVAMHRDGTVCLTVSDIDLEKLGCEAGLKQDSVDMIFPEVDHKELKTIREMGVGVFPPLLTQEEALTYQNQARFQLTPMKPYALLVTGPVNPALNPAFLVLETLSRMELPPLPVILRARYRCSEEELVIHASAELGALLADGFGNGLWIEGPYDVGSLRRLSFGILQAARMRTVKTDFISCPSCGRTLFDLQEVTRRIKSQTAHLPGVKIAIMGCIVNGPGEMADADFGYVGSKAGMIDLYVGKACVEKNIAFADADAHLIALIKAHNRWIEPASYDAPRGSLGSG